MNLAMTINKLIAVFSACPKDSVLYLTSKKCLDVLKKDLQANVVVSPRKVPVKELIEIYARREMIGEQFKTEKSVSGLTETLNCFRKTECVALSLGYVRVGEYFVSFFLDNNDQLVGCMVGVRHAT